MSLIIHWSTIERSLSQYFIEVFFKLMCTHLGCDKNKFQDPRKKVFILFNQQDFVISATVLIRVFWVAKYMYICIHVTFFLCITEILRPSSKETFSGKTAILFFFCNSRADRNSEAFEKTFINWEVRFCTFVTGIFSFHCYIHLLFFFFVASLLYAMRLSQTNGCMFAGLCEHE